MGGDRWFAISFWLCCALLAVPLWTVEYLPMADLPQHAAQIGIWTRWSDPEFGYQNIYKINWFTPYLFGYLLTFVFTPFMSIQAALTTVITLAVVGVPLATLFVLKCVEGNRWWVFAVFPGVFGYAFDWGFYNFLVGIPIALVLMVFAIRYAESPTRRSGVIFSAGMLGLFFVHVLLFAYVALIFGLTVLFKREDWKRGLLTLMPVIALVPLVLLWLVVTRDTEALTHRAMIWELPGDTPRLLRLFSEMAGDAIRPWTLSAGLISFLLPLFLGARFSRSAKRWIPFATTLAVFLLVPHEFLGTGFLYSRYAIFAVPTWLYALEPSPEGKPAKMRLVLGPTLAVACTVATTLQFWAFEPGVVGLRKLIDEMPENARVLSVPVRKFSPYIRTPVFLHTPVWYQAEKGGVVDFSFAINFPLLFRYTAENEPRIPRMFIWNTGMFDWEAFDGASYDYLLVRDFGDGPSKLIVQSNAPVTMLARAGPWQLFGRD
jgi:hypothetical protein